MPTGVPDRPTGLRRVLVHRVDPWSVFVFSLAFSVLLAVATMVAVVLLDVLLTKMGVLHTVNDLVNEIKASPAGATERGELLTTPRILGGAAVLAAANIVLLTALATVLAVLYNACVALTGGIVVTVDEAAD